MNCLLQSKDEKIKEIEDVIDIQKASGIFHARRIENTLPEETVSDVSFNLCLGHSNDREVSSKKKVRRYTGGKYLKGPADLISWPSDSDVTVLRMNLLRKVGGAGQNVYKSSIPGDGLHLPNSSSMVNLATLMPDNQATSKHSLSVRAEEYLFPLSSWDPDNNNSIINKNGPLQIYQQTDAYVKTFPKKNSPFDVVLNCDRNQEYSSNNILTEADCRLRLSQHESNSSLVSLKQTGSRVARFLRLYFCPCCTCLYQLENRCEQNARCAAAASATAAVSSSATAAEDRAQQVGDGRV